MKDLDTAKLEMGFIFAFDIGPVENHVLFSSRCLETFTDLGAATYEVPTGNFRSTQNGNTHLLSSYKDEMYCKRFRAQLLTSLDTLLVQFPSVRTKGLRSKDSEIFSDETALNISSTVTLNAMGVATIVLWLELPPNKSFTYAELQSLRSPKSLRTIIDWTLRSNHPLRINGDFSIEDCARFLVFSIFNAIHGTYNEVVNQEILRGDNLTDIHQRLCDACYSQITLSSAFDTHPIYHIDFTSSAKATSDFVAALVNDHCDGFRGLLTGDQNWEKKKKQLCEAAISSAECSTRESIRWMTHQNGSIKMYSKDLESDITTSKVLITFEVELMVSMRHFCYSIIRNLNQLGSSQTMSLPLRSIASLRDREMRRLDEFYTLDFLQKDTTLQRLDKFKQVFRIDTLLDVALRRFESINLFMNTRHEEISARRQLLLTIVFGVFGTGGLVWSAIQAGIEEKAFALTWPESTILTLTSMLCAALALYFGTRIKFR